MKVVAINGSARKNGNTAALIEAVFEPMRAAGHDCEVFDLAGQRVEGCTVCLRCKREKDGLCHGREDAGNVAIELMTQADAIILASPVYFADVTAEMKAVIDRAGYATRAAGNLLARKPGATLVAERRAGAIHALDTMNHLFTIGEMVLVGSSYWNLGQASEKGAVVEDEEAMRTMRRLGENLTWVMERLIGSPDCP